MGVSQKNPGENNHRLIKGIVLIDLIIKASVPVCYNNYNNNEKKLLGKNRFFL